MTFEEFVCRRAIRSDLAAENKVGAIRELVTALVEAGEVDSQLQSSITESLLTREQLGSTGIGRGIAIPHAKHEAVMRPVAAVGVSRGGLDFDSLDGEKAYIFFLVISPPDRAGDHLRALEKIANSLGNNTLRSCLLQARTADEIAELLEDAEVGELVDVK